MIIVLRSPLKWKTKPTAATVKNSSPSSGQSWEWMRWIIAPPGLPSLNGKCSVHEVLLRQYKSYHINYQDQWKARLQYATDEADFNARLKRKMCKASSVFFEIWKSNWLGYMLLDPSRPWTTNFYKMEINYQNLFMIHTAINCASEVVIKDQGCLHKTTVKLEAWSKHWQFDSSASCICVLGARHGATVSVLALVSEPVCKGSLTERCFVWTMVWYNLRLSPIKK